MPRQRKPTGLYIPHEILNAEGLSWTEKAILSEVYQIVNMPKGTCWASQTYFAERLNICIRTVKSAMKRLQTLDLLKIEKRNIVLNLYSIKGAEVAPFEPVLEGAIVAPSTGGEKVQKLHHKTRTKRCNSCTPKVQKLHLKGATVAPASIERSRKKFNILPVEQKKQRVRCTYFDVLAEVLGMDANLGTNGSRLGQLKAKLSEAGYTEQDLKDFGAFYASRHPNLRICTHTQIIGQIGTIRTEAFRKWKNGGGTQASFLPKPKPEMVSRNLGVPLDPEDWGN